MYRLNNYVWVPRMTQILGVRNHSLRLLTWGWVVDCPLLLGSIRLALMALYMAAHNLIFYRALSRECAREMARVSLQTIKCQFLIDLAIWRSRDVSDIREMNSSWSSEIWFFVGVRRDFPVTDSPNRASLIRAYFRRLRRLRKKNLKLL